LNRMDDDAGIEACVDVMEKRTFRPSGSSPVDPCWWCNGFCFRAI
jgi:hypothetical protein